MELLYHRKRRSLLVDWFGCAGEGSQESEGFLDFDWDWWWGWQVGSHGLVTVLVGDVSGADDRTVWGDVGRCSLDHGDRSAGWTGLQVTDFFLFDSVFGFESETSK